METVTIVVNDDERLSHRDHDDDDDDVRTQSVDKGVNRLPKDVVTVPTNPKANDMGNNFESDPSTTNVETENVTPTKHFAPSTRGKESSNDLCYW